MTLFTKVVLTVVLVVIVALALAGLLASQGAGQAASSYMSEVLRQQAAALAEQAAQVYADTGSWEATQEWIDSSSTGGPGMGHMGQNGAPMGRGMMRGEQRRSGMQTWLLVDPDSGAPLASGGEPVSGDALTVGAPLVVDGATVALLIPEELPTGMEAAADSFRREVNSAIGWSALAAGLVALLAGGVLVGSILRPLHRVEQAVERIKEGDLDTRIEPISRDEIGRLAAGVNQMAASLHEQEQLRQRLVGDIAHELRTPLSVIQGNLQAILDGVYPLEAAEVRVIYDETRLLARLVSDLHELAQAEARRLPLACEAIDPCAALASTHDLFRPLADQKGVALRVEPQTAPAILADPERLQQILHNLVGNALRHTPPGGAVTLSCRQSGSGVRFQVADTGPGVDAADLSHVFDRFYRADRDRSRTADTLTSGTGLGLAIVKALVEAHGGQVGAESEPGRGACFWFVLPSA